jgi:two-component system sensor histidine kinase QseC
MSLQRRLLLYLLVCAPLVWAVTLGLSITQARHEVNELYDSELTRLARQVQAVVNHNRAGVLQAPTTSPTPAPYPANEDDDVRQLAVAVWNAHGQLVLTDREGMQLPHHTGSAGFVDIALNGHAWRVYYLPASNGEWLVAAGQDVGERRELVVGLTVGQIMPWLLMLPFLLLAMAWAVRRALLPIRTLTAELQARDAQDLQPVSPLQAPAELQPLLVAMNHLFTRIEDTLERERRFTADAAHELRTPLAVLRAQWDVVRRSHNGPERVQAEAQFSTGLDRTDRLVMQMLALSRVEARLGSGSSSLVNTPVDWPRIVEQTMGDCLPLAERRNIELACEWPPEGQPALPLQGDSSLLSVLLRNLLDNAIRYAPQGTLVTLGFAADEMVVENAGTPLNGKELARLGTRFHRPGGQKEIGSGLGVSIVQRIAALQGLEVVFGACDNGQGMRVRVQRAHAQDIPLRSATA